jgi:hypothetical protein
MSLPFPLEGELPEENVKRQDRDVDGYGSQGEGEGDKINLLPGMSVV